MSNPKHDKGEHYLLTPKAEPFLERVIFNNRFLILVLFLFTTAFLRLMQLRLNRMLHLRD